MLSYKLYFSVLTGESRCRVKNNGTLREPPFVEEILDSYPKATKHLCDAQSFLLYHVHNPQICLFRKQSYNTIKNKIRIYNLSLYNVRYKYIDNNESGIAKVIRFYLTFIDYINYTLECHSTYVQGIGYLFSRKGYFQGMSSSVLHRTLRV